MCNWLSSGDWCDVQLFCGGRSFNAHRAVLASASSFLRRILLSCPVEETPTCIFLPDFDLEAFSSVIYYIYNGEVAIQKHKLQKFIDVVKTLDIFVDLQCLHKRNSIESSRVYGNKQLLENSNSHRNSTVFALDSGNNSDQYINIKKGEHNQDVHSQSSQDESEFHDNQARLKTNWINPVLLPSSQSLPTFYFDRQKNFFPRDLCLETYPRNGNTNGHTAGVHAISNDSYRAPASVRLTNKPPREDDALSDVTRKTTNHNSHIGYKENLFTDYNNPNENFSKNGDSVSSVFSEEEVKDSWNNLSSLNAPSPSPQLNIGDQFLPEVPLNNTAIPCAGPSHSTSTTSGKKSGLYPLVENTNAQHPLYENTCLEANQQLSRTSIYNQVLENPWCSRLTFNYRPTFKKMPSIIDDEEVDVELVNDNNNNTQQPELSSAEELPEKVLIAAEEAPEKVLISSSQDFKCVICNQVFPDSDRLDEHARQHSSGGRYTCNECGKTFSQLRNFKYHMSVHRGTREFAATCTVCGKYFNDRGYLSSHMKIHKNRKEYKCSMCPKSFNQRVAYNMHVRIHTGVKPHVCSECGKAFSRKMLLKQHQRTHSGERPYACPHCDKRFADRSNMTLHLRLHTGVKPFSCSLCPKSFTKKHHLKSHLNFHTGAKPYSCPRCKLAFTQSSNMRTHYKKCNATEPVADTTSS